MRVQMEGFHKTMLTKPCADKCVLKWYKDMPHGWCAARADVSDWEDEVLIVPSSNRRTGRSSFRTLLRLWRDFSRLCFEMVPMYLYLTSGAEC